MKVQDMTYPELKKLLKDDEKVVRSHEARFRVRVQYKKYIRGSGVWHRRPGVNEKFEIGKIEKFYASPAAALKWADKFPRNRLVKPLEILIKTKMGSWE